MGLQLLQCLCGALPWGEGPSAHGQEEFGVIPSPHARGGSRGGCGQGEAWKEQGQLVVRLREVRGKELWERVLRLCGVYPQIGVGPGGNVHPAWKKTLKIRTQTVLKCAQQPIMPPFRPCQI